MWEQGIVVSLDGDFAGYEGDAPQFRIRTSGLYSSSIAVSLGYEALNPNGATAGVDYYPITIVTIPAFTSFVGVSVPFLRDSLVEGTESFRIRINSVSPGAPVVTFDPARIITGTIFDSTPTNPGDPGDPRVREISINNAVGTEGINPSISFQVTASNNASNAAAVSVFYETFQRSALSGIDYAYQSGFVNFSPNENSKTISIPITNDTIVESTEYFEVRLRSPSVGAVIRTSVGVGSIIDNDVLVRVNVDDAPLVREGAASSFRVWIDNPTRNVSGYLRTTSGSATQNSDYQGGDYYFSIPAGQRETWVGVPTYVNNDPPELDIEDYSAWILSYSGADAIGRGNANGKIMEITPTLTVNAQTYVEEGDTVPNSVLMAFSLPSNYEHPVSINYFTRDRTAFAVSDYYGVSGTVNFVRGVIDPETGTDNRKFVRVYTRPDYVAETPPTEFFDFIIGEPSNARLTSSQRTYAVTIQDDDDVPTLTVEGGQAEEGQPVPFVFKLNRLPSSGGTTVNLRTEDGSAKDGIGEPDADYVPVLPNTIPGSIFLTQLTTTLTINTINDDALESTEDFRLLISNPTNGVRVATPSATGTILDNDTLIELMIADTSVIEGDTGWTNPNRLRFPITRTIIGKQITKAIQVSFATGPVNQFLWNGLPNPRYATPNVDYWSVSNQSVILNGWGNGQGVVDVYGDHVPESDEQLFGYLGAAYVIPNSIPNNGTVTFSYSRWSALGTIMDDDLPKTARVAFDFERILEEEQNCVCTSADGPDEATVTAKDGGLTAPDTDLQLTLGGTNSFNQLQSLQLTRRSGTDLPDSYDVRFAIGGKLFPTTTVTPIAGDASGRLVFTIPLDLTEFVTGFYKGDITIIAKKAVLGGEMSFTVKRDTLFKVINNVGSEYSNHWWNPKVERLYPQTFYRDMYASNPNWTNGALYVRGDQTAWLFDGNTFTTPNGIFATLRRLPSQEFELRFKTGERKIFSSQGILTSEIDRNGNTTVFSYVDADFDGISDELSIITDPLGRQTRYFYSSWTSGGLLTEIRDFSNRSTLYSISNWRLNRISYPDPDDSGPRLRPTKDIIYQFTTAGGFIQLTDAEGLVTKYSFNKYGRVTRIDLPTGAVWQYQYLKDSSVIARLPGGGSTGVAIIPGDMKSVTTNPRGFKTEYNTDRFGFPTKITYPNGSVETYDRNKHGQPLSHTYPDPSGAIATETYAYDSLQNLTSLISPKVGTMIWQYDATYSLPIFVSATGQPDQTFTRDSKGNVTQVTTIPRNTTVGIATNPENRPPADKVFSNPIDRYDVNNDGLVNEQDVVDQLRFVTGRIVVGVLAEL